MSAQFETHFADAKGIIMTGLDGMALIAEGATVPTDATSGYAPGCLFLKRAGSANVNLYKNNGSKTSCLFVPVVGSAQGAALTAAAATITQAGTDSGDVAIQAITDSSPFGFANAAEGEAVVARVLNLMVRVGEIEAALEAAGIIAAN